MAISSSWAPKSQQCSTYPSSLRNHNQPSVLRLSAAALHHDLDSNLSKPGRYQALAYPTVKARA